MHAYLIPAACFAILLILVFAIIKSHAKRTKPSSHKSVPISKRRIFLLANRLSILVFLLISLASALIFVFAWQTEHLSLRAACISWAVSLVLIGFGFIPVFHTRSGAWQMMRQIKDFDRLTEGKALEYYIGSWYYSDRDLLICIGSNSACILYAPMIDFSVRFRYESSNWHFYKASTAYYKRFVVPLKGGGKSKQMLAFNNVVCDWIHQNGGRITGIDS